RKEENGRQRNGTNQSARLPDILWKTFILSSGGGGWQGGCRQKAARLSRCSAGPRLSRRESLRHCERSEAIQGAARKVWIASSQVLLAMTRGSNDDTPQKPKDPPGGTTGRVKLYGRWGGWALAPYTALSGRDNRSHLHWSPKTA